MMASTALAADVLPATPAFNWTGFYIGVNGGLGFGSNKFSERSLGVSSDAGGFGGALGGLTLGANYQMSNNWVLGIEGDLDLSSLQADDGRSISFGCVGPAQICRTNVDWLGTARARLGIDLSNSALLFATGGLAVGGVKGTFVTPGTVSGSGTNVGWTVGAGIEKALTSNLSAKAEVDYVSLGRLELPTFCSSRCYTDINFATAKIGLNYRF